MGSSSSQRSGAGLDLFSRIVALRRQGESAVLCTVIRTRGSVPRHEGAKMLVLSDGSIQGTVGGGEMESRVIADALGVLRSKETRIVHYALQNPSQGDPGVCGGELEVFLEPIHSEAKLLVVGAGHVGRAVVHLGRWLGFHVTLSDDREDHCTPHVVPGADRYLAVPIGTLPQHFDFDDHTYVLLLTRGVPLDVEGLPHLLEVPHAFLGVIGSRRRWGTAVKQLLEIGVAKEKLETVHAPVGLELNAETPEEIAISIMAEVLAVLRGGTGDSMRWQPQANEVE